MIITSEVLGLYGQASGLGETETNDAVLSVPPLLMPTTKLYRPCTSLHAGFLAQGMATTSFFYSDRFSAINAAASDTITIVLGKGIWELNITISSNKTYNSATIFDFFALQISYDEGATFASLYRSHTVTNNASTEAILQPYRLTSTGVVGTRAAFFAHMPLSPVGQTSMIAVQIAGLRLV